MLKLIRLLSITLLAVLSMSLTFTSCEKDNPQPVDVDKTELVVTLGDADFLPFTYSVNNPNSVGDLHKVQNNVRKGESTKIVLPETVTKGTNIFVHTARFLDRREISEIDVKVNSSKYKVHYEEPVIEIERYNSFNFPIKYSVVYIIRIR